MENISGARVGLVTSWLSRRNGGVFEAVVLHARILRSLGLEPVIFGLWDDNAEQDILRFGDIEVNLLKTAGPAQVGYAPKMKRGLMEGQLDILHLHGIWQYPSEASSYWANKTGRPYLITVHGMLDGFIVGRGKRKKAMARLAYERRSWRRASAFHALTADEAVDIRTETGRAECIVIPNAVGLASRGGRRELVFVYLGRVHPKKNLTGLIEGWKLARDVLTPLGARLRVAGWGDPADVSALRALIAASGGSDIEFVGPVFEHAKSDLLNSARFLALSSHSEGLPMAILEAWAAGTPTLMSRHCHLPEGFEAGAALDCGTDPETIAACLRTAAKLNQDKWFEMSSAAEDLARTTFSPEAVAQNWAGAYSALLKESRSHSAGRPKSR